MTELNKKFVVKGRLSYPNIFKKGSFNGEENKKYDAQLFVEKNSVDGKKLIANLTEFNKSLKKPVGNDKVCIKDGDNTGDDNSKGCWILKVSSNNRPLVVDTNGSQLVEDDNRIYAGCYVGIGIDFWEMDNAFGKRINANMHVVRFWKDGEPFGAGVSSVNSFDDWGDDFEEDSKGPDELDAMFT